MAEDRTGVIGTCWGRVSRRRGIVLLASALLLSAPLATADAGTQTLCRGYAKCRAGGYSDAGYQANSQQSYWRMFSGPNCTNYVAYRLVRDGLTNARPAADRGQSNASLNAFAWGVAYASLTNGVPKVGSVAWWGANAGKGRIGHVAYVEKVHRDGTVTISEDSSSGNGFAWKKLTPGQDYPQGFIHFGADNPRALTTPSQAQGRRPAERRAAERRPVERPPVPQDTGGQKEMGQWTDGTDWFQHAEGRRVPERVDAGPVQRSERKAFKPRRNVAKKATSRWVGNQPMGGEVGGALSASEGFQGAWGPGGR